MTPSFLEEALDGSLKNTTILLMSCYGSIDDTLGRIFTERGGLCLHRMDRTDHT